MLDPLRITIIVAIVFLASYAIPHLVREVGAELRRMFPRDVLDEEFLGDDHPRRTYRVEHQV